MPSARGSPEPKSSPPSSPREMKHIDYTSNISTIDVLATVDLDDRNIGRPYWEHLRYKLIGKLISSGNLWDQLLDNASDNCFPPANRINCNIIFDESGVL